MDSAVIRKDWTTGPSTQGHTLSWETPIAAVEEGTGTQENRVMRSTRNRISAPFLYFFQKQNLFQQFHWYVDCAQTWGPRTASWGGCERYEPFCHLEVRYELKKDKKKKDGHGKEEDAVQWRVGTSAGCLLLAQGPVPTGPTLGRFRCIWSFLLGSKRWDGIKERTAQLDVSKYFPPRKRNTSRGWYSQEVVYAL